MNALLALLALWPTPQWSVNPRHTLVWEGEPYLPVGLRVEGSVDAVRLAAEAGVSDLVVELPADGTGWKSVVQELEERGMRYAVALTSAAPTAPAVVVEPDGYRLPGIERKTSVRLRLEGASEALLVLAKASDGSVRWSRRVVVTDGVVESEIDPLVQVSHVLLVYPVVADLRAPDFGQAYDAHRDTLLEALESTPLGPGARAILDVGGAGATQPGPETTAVPTSTVFRLEMADFLERKYATLPTALKAWGVSTNDVSNFAQLARTVPLWSQARGVAQLWDPVGDRLYPVETRSSVAWSDIRACLRDLATRRTARLAEAVKAKTGLPLVRTWSSWASGFPASTDGLGFRPTGPGLPDAVEAGAGPMSEALRRAEPGFVWALDVPVSTLTPETAVAELEGMGVRGWFFRAANREEAAAVGRLVATRKGDVSAAEWTVKALFFPDAARDPAVPARLRGGTWWLPTPYPGERLDLGPGFEGYRIEAPEGTSIAVWATEPAPRTRFLTPEASKVQATDLDGQPIEVRRRRDAFELDLTQEPVVLRGVGEQIVPERSLAETAGMLTALFDTMENRVDPTGQEKFAFLDTLQASKSRPAEAFKAMRAQLTKVVPRVAPYVWLSAARPRATNLGAPVRIPGSAFEQSLVLNTRLDPAAGVFYAEYQGNVRNEGEYEVWVSGRIPDAAREGWRVRIGAKTFTPEPPVSVYGPGFAWSRFGTLNLPRGLIDLRLELSGQRGVEAVFDVVALMPVGFRPSGPRVPTEFLRSLPPPKRTGDGRG